MWQYACRRLPGFLQNPPWCALGIVYELSPRYRGLSLFQFPIVRDACDEPQIVQIARQGEGDKATDNWYWIGGLACEMPNTEPRLCRA
jgi:hypothetical protein